MILAILILFILAIGVFFILRHGNVKSPLIWSLLFFLIVSGSFVGYILFLGDRPSDDAIPIIVATPSQTQNFPLLPSEATINIEKGKTVIKYCPDNTCNIVEAPTSVDKTVFEDFAVLYFNYASGYIYLDKSFDGKIPYRKQSQDKVKEIVSRQKQNCEGDQLSVVNCIMLRLSRNHKIKTAFSRFDEGIEAVTAYDPNTQYSEKKLREIQAWYKKQ